MVDTLVVGYADAERHAPEDLVHDARQVPADVRVEQVRGDGLVTAADVITHSRWGDVVTVSDDAAYRLAVSYVPVRAHGAGRRVTLRHTPLELLDRPRVYVTYDSYVHHARQSSSMER